MIFLLTKEYEESLLIAMKIKYNTDKTSRVEHSLKVSLVLDAKRIKDFTSLPGRPQSDSLWRHCPYSSVFLET